VSSISYLALLNRAPTPRPERITRFVGHLCADLGFTILLDRPTLLVAAADVPHVMQGNREGIVLGHLFDRNGGTRITDDSAPDADMTAEHMAERYWGGYVAFSTGQATPSVMRDPSGAVPCYHIELSDVHILTSRPDLVIEAGLVQPEIDPVTLTQAIVYRDLRPSATTLKGISEILPGMAGRLYPPGLETRCAWSPWRFTLPDAEIDNFDEATNLVRQAATVCLTAWGNCFAKPLVEISGGLDSAIVAAGLTRSRARPQAITYAAAPGDPDELPYAQAIADFLKLPLETARPDRDGVQLALSDAASLPRPCARNFSQPFDRAAQSVARSIDADAFFSGGGGDNVFSYQRTLTPVIDRVRRHGPFGLVTTISDIATLGETSIWHVAARAARRLAMKKTPPLWNEGRQFLTTAALEALPFPQGHPWIESPPGTLPGKRAHVQSLIRMQNHLEGHGRLALAPIIWPLLSQPLVEACLSIPSWLWCTGGRNRAVARAAFAEALPVSAIARQGKGAFDSYSARLFAARQPELRELLLDGVLASMHLLDRPGLDAALRHPMLASETIVRIWHLADVEAWARGWTIRAQA
jgi:asparagine synthase (glutamine-hydrolysing)